LIEKTNAIDQFHWTNRRLKLIGVGQNGPNKHIEKKKPYLLAVSILREKKARFCKMLAVSRVL